MLVDSIHSNNSGIQDELNVTLLLPLYIWPAYRTWILGEFPARSRVNQGEAIQWLLDAHLRETGFAELDILDPDNRLLSYLELKKNTTNLSRWIKDGFERLYHAIYLAVVQTIPDQRDRPDAEGISISRSDSEQNDQGDHQDGGISRARILSTTNRFNDASEAETIHPDSPIFLPYLQNIEVSRTFLDLQRASQAAPPLTQVARMIIDRHLHASNLDIGQQALAMEMLSYLPDWICSDNLADQSISFRSIDLRWRQFHSSDPAPLVRALLEGELLQIAGQDGRVRFSQQLIHDFFLSLMSVTRLHSTNPTSPRGVSLSTWLYWRAIHWMENGNLENAGMVLWHAGGSLPGYMSGTWRQLAYILEYLPRYVLTDSHIRSLAAIAMKTLSRNGGGTIGHLNWLFERDFTAQISRSQVLNAQPEIDMIIQDYIAGMEDYLILSNSDPLYILEIALGYDQTIRKNMWCRKHAFSALRGFDPKKVLEVPRMPYIYQKKTSKELILDFTKKENHWDLRLAAVELLTAWSIQEATQCVKEHEISDLPIEYYSRARILRGALEGIPGYQDWV